MTEDTRSDTRSISLICGQHTEIVATATTSKQIRCLSGQLHIASMRMGIGWSMHAGDACLLRVNTHYRVTARTRSTVAVSSGF